MSNWMIPTLFVLVLTVGLWKSVDCFEAFTEGAAAGLKTTFSILPPLICLMICIQMVQASGILEIAVSALSSWLEKAGLLSELLPLGMMRPLSGSGSLTLYQQILTTYGPDSLIGKAASVLQGSGETTFYTISLYFGSIYLRRTRYAIPAALVGDLVVFTSSCWISQLIWS